MDEIRIFLASLLFVISSYLTIDLFTEGFDWVTLLVILAGFILAHFVWPKNTRFDSDWLDLVEMIVDFPYQVIRFLLRLLGKGSSHDSDFGDFSD